MLCTCRWNAALAALLFLQTNCAAHPESYVDAWVRVSDVVDVRLSVFVDDVVRFSDPDSAARGVVTADTGERLVAGYGAIITEQLRMTDGRGNYLVPVVISEPTIELPPGDLDLDVDSSHKLTWKLRYELSSGESVGRSLCFLHFFSSSLTPQAGELRLHLKHEESGRRFDAVIPAQRPHTILFPGDESWEPRVRDAGINEAHSRVIIGAVDVVHEFTAPLALLKPASDILASASGTAEELSVLPAALTTTEAAQLSSRVRQWLQDHVSLESNGITVQPAGFHTEWITAGEPIAEQLTQQRVGDVPVLGTRLAVRAVYAKPNDMRSGRLVFDANPGGFAAIQVDVVTANEQTSSITPFEESVDEEGHAAVIEWSVPHMDSVMVSAEAGTGELPLLTRHDVRPGRTGLVIAVICCVGVLFAALWLRSVRGRAIVICVLGVTAALVVCLCPDHVWSVNAESAAQQLESMLDLAYRSAAEPDETRAVSALSSVLDEALTEEVYLATVRSLHAAATDPVLMRIESVTVEEFVPVEGASSPSEIEGECRWRVRGQVQHWGHSHTRELVQSAWLGLASGGGSWKITALVLTDAGRFEIVESEEAGS